MNELWRSRVYIHAYQLATSALAGGVDLSRASLDIATVAADPPTAAEDGPNAREQRIEY